MSASIKLPDQDTIYRAARLILDGSLVAIPTETVYGLAADATNGEAVAKIFAAKGRPKFNPLISHVSHREMAESLAILDETAYQLMDRFWPGPLTLVLPKSSNCPVSELATAGLDSIAIRCPKHPVARGLIETVGVPLAAPSANPSEMLSPTTAQHVAELLGDKLDLILDGGPCEAGIESTVVSLIGEQPTLLRPGSVSRLEIEATTSPLAEPGGNIISPGMMRRHYAPSAKLRLNAECSISQDEAFLGFGPFCASADANLSPTANLGEAAANLFAMLRILDLQYDKIAVAPIPAGGLGEAINDRLKRAAV